VPDSSEVSRLLKDWREGDCEAMERLIPIVYAELRRLAAHYLRAERPDHTLQPTALVHEAYLRLVAHGRRDWQNRAHFFAVAAETMRALLVDHARARLAVRRGGGMTRVELAAGAAAGPGESPDILALDAALERLARRDARQARVVELRYFGGLSNEEVAQVLGISERTVKREWALARAWLYAELRRRPS